MADESNIAAQKDIQLHDILTHLPNLVYILDKDCTLVDGNQAFLNLLGIENIQELQSSFYKQLVRGAQWSKERVESLKLSDINALLGGEALHQVMEPPIVDKNDVIHYFRASRIPLIRDNKPMGLLVFFVDISEELRLKNQVDRLKKQLQQQNEQAEPPSTLFERKPDDIIPHVLLIEDNSIAQKAVQGILMQLDCKVETASSAEEVMELFVPGKYNIIFMDIGLKDTSGYVIAKQLRQREQGTAFHTTIIALTGYEADIVKYDCTDYSMEGAITKPLTTEQAKQIIQHYIYHIDIPVRGLKSV